MRIGLISDTHVPEAGSRLPPEVYDHFDGVDMVLHAGDMHVIDVLDWLERVAPTVGARGNGDGDGFRPPFPDDDPGFARRTCSTSRACASASSTATPLPEEAPWISQEALMERSFGGPVDVIVCGDTHIPVIQRAGPVLIVNPGSPMLPRNVRAPGAVGILTISDGLPAAEIIQLTRLE